MPATLPISRRQALGLALLPLLPLPALALSAQDQRDVARITAYINGIKTLKADFLQIAPSGATSTGKVWMERPGRIRFQYAPPSPILLVAGDGLLIYHNSQLNQTSTLPLSKTPLGILLQDNLTLSGDVTVTSVVRDPGAIAVGLVRTGQESEGELTLLFADDPLEFRGWVMRDAQRQETRISLDNLDFAATGFSPDMFTYVSPSQGQSNGF